MSDVTGPRIELYPVGRVESPLTERAAAPRQGEQGVPEACLVLDPAVAEAARELREGSEILVLTWLDRADRTLLRVCPGRRPDTPETGVFSTRSPDRPNPIGLHRVQVVAVTGTRVQVRNLEALDGTPVIDIKPVIDQYRER
jgi:tRNA-Thr(GGU) m(6)t(6)A37 methyltransferase TsaA